MKVNFAEGHDGVFDIRLNDDLLYTNSSECGRLPEMSDVAGLLRERGYSRKEGVDDSVLPAASTTGIHCPLPAVEEEAAKELPMAGDDCGCK